MHDTAQGFFVAGTVAAMFAGGLHAVYALIDTVRPRYFAPVDRSVRAAMESTSIRLIRPLPWSTAEPSSLWRIWLGINIVFGVAVFAFGLVCLLIASYDFGLVERIDLLRPLTIGFSAAILAVAIRFFFYGPAFISATATACFTVATVLTA